MAAHISKVSKRIFETDLKTKIEVIETWVANGIPWKTDPEGVLSRDTDGEKELDYFPKSVAAFCEWDGANNSQFVRTTFPAIKKTNRSTLYLNHSSEQAKIDSLCKNLAKLAHQQLSRSNKAKRLKNSNGDVALLRAILVTQETEITVLRKCSIANGTKLTQSETALENTRTHYESEMANLRKQVADLTALVRSLRPLRKERPDER